MNHYILSTFVLILSIALFTTSCGDDDDDTGNQGTQCNTTDITYTNTIGAIFNSSCAASGCHTTSNAGTIGSLANYADAAAFAAFGRIGGAINHSSGFEPMPYPTGAAKLSDCNIDKIEAWIAGGMLE